MGKEHEVGHEKIIDYDFRVPSVEGMGSGLGFRLNNLVLPKNYEDLIKKLNPKIDLSKSFNRMLDEDCKPHSLPQGYVEFKDNLLSQIVFGGLGDSPRLFLDERRSDIRTGMSTYQFENVDNIRTALVLAKTAAGYMNLLAFDEKGYGGETYAYVDCSGANFGGFFSANLKIPDDLAEKAKKADGKHFQERFALEANNIAGRFGMTVRSLHYENQFLQWIDILEGNACDYTIHEGSIYRNSYSPHNVDNPWQAFALHGVGAAYINRLLDMRSSEAHK